MSRKKYSSPLRYLGDFHDFIRALYFLQKGLSKYQFAKLMSVDDSAAIARLEGWVQAGVVERRDDGKYYLVAGSIEISGFGRIDVHDHTIQITIDPYTKFVSKVKYDPDRVAIRVLRDGDR